MHYRSEELKISSLIDRLVDLEYWPLAISICRYMKVPSKEGVYRVLAYWALKKVVPRSAYASFLSFVSNYWVCSSKFYSIF